MRARSYALAVGAVFFVAGSAPVVAYEARIPSCNIDLRNLCAGVDVGAPLEECLRSHMDQVSEPCANDISEALYVVKECAADFNHFCPDVKPGNGAVARCMRPHLFEVSFACKLAVAEVTLP